MLRYSTLHKASTVAKRTQRSRKWLWAAGGVAATAGVTAISYDISSSQHEQEDAAVPSSPLGYLKQQLSKSAGKIWPSAVLKPSSSGGDKPSFKADALNRVRATSARWLAQWAVDPEAREALLAFGSTWLLDFLLNTATDDPSPEQAHAEQAVVNFLAGGHTSARLLARPGAVPRLLHHAASGKASDEFVEGLTAVLEQRGADLSQGLSLQDGKDLITMLQGRQGPQVQGLALQLLTSWASCGGQQCKQLAGLGLAPALGQLAMEAMAQGEQGRQLQAAVCRLQRVLLASPCSVTDADLAGWMQPLLFMAADAAAAAAAAAASGAGKSPYTTAADAAGVGTVTREHSGGGGVLGLAAGAADLAVADVAMTTLAAAVAAGGPLARDALSDLHLIPTLDCLALSPDPAIKARAAAALAAFVTAGQIESEEARSRWRDMLLTWLISSTSRVLKKNSSGSSGSGGGSADSSSWLLGSWWGDVSSSGGSSDDDAGAADLDPADAALARSCVAALRALSLEGGPSGLSVTQLWLSKLLLQLSSRVAAYTSITTLTPSTSSSSSSSAGSSGSGAAGKAVLAAAAAMPGSGGTMAGSAAAAAATAARTSAADMQQPAADGSADSTSAGSTEAASSSSSSSSSSWSWWGGRWWWWSSSSDKTNTKNNNVTDSNNMEEMWSQLEAAKAAHWRDAAPVTPATARAAAEDLRAASNAMLGGWGAAAAAGSLALPSDLVPGMFAPAIVEEYPAAARVVDYAVAQQRTLTVMELLACVVAEDPTKQAWLLAAGILPIMERLVLHSDAGLDPEAFIAKYSSSSGGGGSSSSGGSSRAKSSEQSRQDSSSSSSSAEDASGSGHTGRSWWGGWGIGSSSSSSGGSSSSGVKITEGAAAAAEVKALPGTSQTALAALPLDAVQQRGLVGACKVQGLEDGRAAARVGSSSSNSSGDCDSDADILTGSRRDQHCEHPRNYSYQCEFGLELDDVAWGDRDVAAAPGSSAAAVGRWLADGFVAKFKGAALSTTTGSSSSSAPDAAAAAAAAPAGPEDFSNNEPAAPAAAAAAAADPAAGQNRSKPQQQQQQYIPPAVLMEFAQGAASWDLNPSEASSALNPGTSAAAADAATAITAAAEELPSWIDGEGLGFLCLQRQVARLLGMLALQPEAAQQLAEAAQEAPGGAVAVLESIGLGFKVGVNPKAAKALLKPGPGLVAAAGEKGGSNSSSSGSSSGSGVWLPWLLTAATSDDCLLSSYATVALLHLESAVAHNQHYQHLQRNHYHTSNGSNGSSGSSSSWRQRLAQELRSAEDLAEFLEELWPFSNSSSSSNVFSNSSGSSSSSGVWRPPVSYPDGIHLLNPTNGHHWGLLHPPPATLLESLSAAATAAASAAVAAAASDLSQSHIDPPVRAPPLDAAAAAEAAAAAAAAAASALGADTSQLQHGSSGSGGSSSSSSSADLGFLQPAVAWLAQKLVRFAEIKEEQVQQAHAAGSTPGPNPSGSGSDPAAPLSTYAAVQALLPGGSSCSSSNLAAVQQQQQQSVAPHPAAPEFDVVFIHGIRGGPFVTWRRGGVYQRGSSKAAAAAATAAAAAAAAEPGEDGSSKGGSKGVGGKGSIPLTPSAAAAAHKNHMTRSDCWPAEWLSADLPGARLLSVEYKAPVTGWEGESLSLPDSGQLLLDKLVAAGVGQRPVVFVAHSMGGLLVKEMLSLSLDEPSTSKRGRLAAATKAIAFYSTPHFGSSMAALGWKLRHLPGASPAPSIHHLSPGPHLAALNARLAALHDSGRVQVLSFTEGLATSLAGLGFIPKILIVPFESAYPGFGAVHVLEEQDHIDVCKPRSRDAPAYELLLQFVRSSLSAAGVGGVGDGDGDGSRVDASVDDVVLC